MRKFLLGDQPLPLPFSSPAKSPFTSLHNSTYQPPAIEELVHLIDHVFSFSHSLCRYPSAISILRNNNCCKSPASLVIAKIRVVFHLAKSNHASHTSVNHMFNFLLYSANALFTLRAPRSCYANSETCSLLCRSCRWRLRSPILCYDNI